MTISDFYHITMITCGIIGVLLFLLITVKFLVCYKGKKVIVINNSNKDTDSLTKELKE